MLWGPPMWDAAGVPRESCLHAPHGSAGNGGSKWVKTARSLIPCGPQGWSQGATAPCTQSRDGPKSSVVPEPLWSPGMLPVWDGSMHKEPGWSPGMLLSGTALCTHRARLVSNPSVVPDHTRSPGTLLRGDMSACTRSQAGPRSRRGHQGCSEDSTPPARRGQPWPLPARGWGPAEPVPHLPFATRQQVAPVASWQLNAAGRKGRSPWKHAAKRGEWLLPLKHTVSSCDHRGGCTGVVCGECGDEGA